MSGSTQTKTFNEFSGRAQQPDGSTIAARRILVRGGVTCTRPMPFQRVAVVTDVRGPRRASRQRVAQPPLRLTRRGRMVLILLPAAAVLATLMVTVAGPIAQASNGPAGHLQTVTVHAGDSLWSIAERIAPADDPRDVVAEIRRVNAMDDATVQPGESLAVPAEYATARDAAR